MFSRITDVNLVRSPDKHWPYEVWYARRTWYGKQWLVEKFHAEPEAIAHFEYVREIAANPVIRSFSLPLINEKTLKVQIMHSTQIVSPNPELQRKLKEALRWMKKNGVRRASEV